jgi:hypothetical protein
MVARNTAGSDAVLFERPQHADVRQTTRGAAAQCKAEPFPFR